MTTKKNQEIRDNFGVYNLNGITVIIGCKCTQNPKFVYEHIPTGRINKCQPKK
jgi:hypothetical protein